MHISYILDADMKHPMRCDPLKTWKISMHVRHNATCRDDLFSCALVAFFFLFMVATVPFHYISSSERTLTHCWLSRHDLIGWGPPPPHTPHKSLWAVKQQPRSLFLWEHASALCMFMSNIWNKLHPLAETTQINLVNSQAESAARAAAEPTWWLTRGVLALFN